MFIMWRREKKEKGKKRRSSSIKRGGEVKVGGCNRIAVSKCGRWRRLMLKWKVKRVRRWNGFMTLQWTTEASFHSELPLVLGKLLSSLLVTTSLITAKLLHSMLPIALSTLHFLLFFFIHLLLQPPYASTYFYHLLFLIFLFYQTLNIPRIFMKCTEKIAGDSFLRNFCGTSFTKI